jgi:hypothetical protein
MKTDQKQILLRSVQSAPSAKSAFKKRPVIRSAKTGGLKPHDVQLNADGTDRADESGSETDCFQIRSIRSIRQIRVKKRPVIRKRKIGQP